MLSHKSQFFFAKIKIKKKITLVHQQETKQKYY